MSKFHKFFLSTNHLLLVLFFWEADWQNHGQGLRALWHLKSGKGMRVLEYLLMMMLKHICFFLLLSFLSSSWLPCSEVLCHDYFLFHKPREQRAASILAIPESKLKTATGREKWPGCTEGTSTIVHISNKFLLCQIPMIQGLDFQPRISTGRDICMSHLTVRLPNKW